MCVGGGVRRWDDNPDSKTSKDGLSLVETVRQKPKTLKQKGPSLETDHECQTDTVQHDF